MVTVYGMEGVPAGEQEWAEAWEAKDTVDMEEEEKEEEDENMEKVVGDSTDINPTQSDATVQIAPHCDTTASSQQFYIHHWGK